MLRKHTRKVVPVIVFSRRQKGNNVTRGQGEQLAKTKMGSKGKAYSLPKETKNEGGDSGHKAGR